MCVCNNDLDCVGLPEACVFEDFACVWLGEIYYELYYYYLPVSIMEIRNPAPGMQGGFSK